MRGHEATALQKAILSVHFLFQAQLWGGLWKLTQQIDRFQLIMCQLGDHPGGQCVSTPASFRCTSHAWTSAGLWEEALCQMAHLARPASPRPQLSKSWEDWSEESTGNLQRIAHILAESHGRAGFQHRVGSQEPWRGLDQLSAWREAPRKCWSLGPRLPLPTLSSGGLQSELRQRVTEPGRTQLSRAGSLLNTFLVSTSLSLPGSY